MTLMTFHQVPRDRLQLLNDFFVAAHRLSSRWNIGIDDEDQVVELSAARRWRPGFAVPPVAVSKESRISLVDPSSLGFSGSG